MRRSGLAMTGLLYALTTLSMAAIGVIVPFMSALSGTFGASSAQIGIAISLFSLPSAVLATVGGAAIDGFGLRRSLILAGAIAVLGDIVASAAPSIGVFDLALLLSGVAFAGISVAAPAMIVTAMEGGGQVRAISFWSTYAPTGYALGLLMAVPFAASGRWQAALLLHAVLIGIVTLAATSLPALEHATGGAVAVRLSPLKRLRGLAEIFRDGPMLRLGIAVALPNGISYGTSLVAPAYLARIHNVGIAQSSTTVAAAKIFAMVVGGLAIGHLLARRINVRMLFAALAVIGVAAQIVLYSPSSSFPVAAMALIVWLFAFGGMAGGAMAQLSAVVRDPAKIGVASGLVGQLISIASFAAPSGYFALTDWRGYCGIATVGLLVSAVLLPGGTHRVLPAARTLREA